MAPFFAGRYRSCRHPECHPGVPFRFLLLAAILSSVRRGASSFARRATSLNSAVRPSERDGYTTVNALGSLTFPQPVWQRPFLRGRRTAIMCSSAAPTPRLPPSDFQGRIQRVDDPLDQPHGEHLHGPRGPSRVAPGEHRHARPRAIRKRDAQLRLPSQLQRERLFLRLLQPHHRRQLHHRLARFQATGLPGTTATRPPPIPRR